MTRRNSYASRWAALWVLLAVCLGTNAAEVVYRIVEYNKTTGSFTLAASGEVPKDAWAEFENNYGATTGNRYNQIPRNQKATLYLYGWQGCRLKKITLSMCSNNKTGQTGLSLVDGETTLYTERPSDFASAAWFGQWVSKDLNVYVDIDKVLDVAALTTDEAALTLQGGTAEGSVYLNAITIDYDAPEGTALESPLGWAYERLEKKSTLAEGDEVMIYRNGCAATDMDGIETSHYLDALSIASTTDVSDPYVLRFRLGKGSADGCWTLTNQYGSRLCASGKQALAWDEGTDEWTIELGYDGATITSSNAVKSTLRFNAPESSYARFALYTSNSLPLPFLYRRTHQLQPIKATSIRFDEESVSVPLDKGTLALTPTLAPTSTTDKRLRWTSSNEQVATVNGGFVMLHHVGDAIIEVQSADGEVSASVRLHVTAASAIDTPQTSASSPQARKVVRGHRVVIERGGKCYTLDGAAL